MRSPIVSRSYGSVRIFWLDAAEALRRLREAAARPVAARPEVRRAVLFGSLAQGRAVPGSDADVLVIVDAADGHWLDRALRYQPYFDDVGVPVDLFCYTPQEAAGGSARPAGAGDGDGPGRALTRIARRLRPEGGEARRRATPP